MNFEIDEATREKLMKLSSTFFGALDMAAALAAPRYLAKADISKKPTRAQLLELFDDFIAVLEQPGQPATEKDVKTIEAARRLRAALDDWEFSLQAPEPVVSAAREVFEAFAGSPEEGWDAWEGPEE